MQVCERIHDVYPKHNLIKRRGACFCHLIPESRILGKCFVKVPLFLTILVLLIPMAIVNIKQTASRKQDVAPGICFDQLFVAHLLFLQISNYPCASVVYF